MTSNFHVLVYGSDMYNLAYLIPIKPVAVGNTVQVFATDGRHSRLTPGSV